MNQPMGCLSTDNTNIYSFIIHILEVELDLIEGNCHAHIAHNSVKHVMNCLNYDTEKIILKIDSHFSSAWRRGELKTFVTLAEREFRDIKRHLGTRWLSLPPAIDTILLNWTPKNKNTIL